MMFLINEEESVKEEVTKNTVPSEPKEEVVTEQEPKKETVTKEEPKKEEVDTKELEELRKFKAEVVAERKLEATKPKEVVVSDTFFGKKVNFTEQGTKSNTEKAWEELFEEEVTRRKRS